MNVLNRITTALANTFKRSAFVPPIYSPVHYGGLSYSGQRVDDATAMGLSALWCGMRVISADIGCLEPKVYRETPTGREEDPKHPLRRLMKYPNPENTGLSLRETMQAQALLHGTAYAEIVRDFAGKPVELWPIPTNLVSAYRNYETGSLVYRVSGGPEMTGENLLTIPGLSPDAAIGYNLLVMLREAIGFGLGAVQYGNALFRQGVRPSGMLQTQTQLSDGARENLRRSFEHMHAGTANAGRMMVLEEGVTFSAYSHTNEQVQYVALLEFVTNQVAQMLCIPPHKLQNLQRATWGNLQELSRDYLNTTLRPWLEKWEVAMEWKLLSEAEREELVVEFDTSDLLRADQASRYTAYNLALAGKQWRTVNEVRAEENLPPIVGGDTLGDAQDAMDAADVTETEPTPPDQPEDPPDDVKSVLLQEGATNVSP